MLILRAWSPSLRWEPAVLTLPSAPEGLLNTYPAGRQWRTQGDGPSQGVGAGFSGPEPGFQSWADHMRRGEPGRWLPLPSTQHSSSARALGPLVLLLHGSPEQCPCALLGAWPEGNVPNQSRLSGAAINTWPNCQHWGWEDRGSLGGGAPSKAGFYPASRVAPLGDVSDGDLRSPG